MLFFKIFFFWDIKDFKNIMIVNRSIIFFSVVIKICFLSIFFNFII